MSNPENTAEHNAFRAKQDGIYAKIATAGANLGITDTLRNDVKESQGAYLVAWRHPDYITEPISEASWAVGLLADAVVYGRDNLHSTISDYDLRANLTVKPDENEYHKNILELLSGAVKSGLDKVGWDDIKNRSIEFDQLITNGGSVIAPGQANDETLDLRSAILTASRKRGIDLGGSWGSHMTVNRFTAESDLPTASRVARVLGKVPTIGKSVPTAIDVGYLRVSQDAFRFTTYERFPLNHE